MVGRYVLTPAVFEHLERIGKGSGGEIQLTDGIAALMGEEAVYAHRFTGKRYDCGSKLGYLQATVEYALAPSAARQGIREVPAEAVGGRASRYELNRAEEEALGEAAGEEEVAAGSHNVMAAPPPSRFARLRRPPCASTISRHSVRPSPVPEGLVE